MPDFKEKEIQSCIIALFVSTYQYRDGVWTYTISKDESRIKRFNVVRWTLRTRGICNWLAKFVCMLIEEYLYELE